MEKLILALVVVCGFAQAEESKPCADKWKIDKAYGELENVAVERLQMLLPDDGKDHSIQMTNAGYNYRSAKARHDQASASLGKCLLDAAAQTK